MRGILFVCVTLLANVAWADGSAVSGGEFDSIAPTNLAQLLALSPEQLDRCDIARMNLLCAEGLRGAEDLNVKQCLDTLDQWTHHIDDETLRNYHRFLDNPEDYGNSKGVYRMMMLATVLQEDFGAHYDPDRALPQLRGQRESNDVFFADAGDVFIHGLLGGERHGTCSSLPVLYAAVAQRLGYPVDLASAEEHFYLRYEDGTNHLNVDASGEGFITHPDEEYRRWPHPLTDEEIKTYGYLQPMSHKQILGAFLAIRAANLTSAKRFDEAAQSWQAASRYLPSTPALNRIVARAQERAENIHKADRWDELWDKVLAQPIPDNEPQTQHFLDRQAELLLYMNRSTDVAAIEKAAVSLKDEVDAYVKAVTTDMHHVKYRLVVVPMAPAQMQTVSQDNFSEAVDVSSQTRTIQIPAQSVPYAYRESMPPELLSRLQKLNNASEMIEEMQAYSAEETRLHNVELQNQMSLPPIQPVPLPLGQHPQTTIQSQDLPLPWRGRTIPPELQERLANLQLQNAPETQIKQTIDDFFIGQDQLQFAVKDIRARREALDRQPATHPPFNIEIAPETPMPENSILLLTNAPLRTQIFSQKTK